MEFLESPHARGRVPERVEVKSALEQVSVICTGGLYDDPEHGPTARHERQKLRLFRLTRSGRVSQLYEREPPVKCPQCGRTVAIAGSYTEFVSDDPENGPKGEDGLPAMRYTGGVWLRIIEWAATTYPTRRVVVVDISDPRYPW